MTIKFGETTVCLSFSLLMFVSLCLFIFMCLHVCLFFSIFLSPYRLIYRYAYTYTHTNTYKHTHTHILCLEIIFHIGYYFLAVYHELSHKSTRYHTLSNIYFLFLSTLFLFLHLHGIVEGLFFSLQFVCVSVCVSVCV